MFKSALLMMILLAACGGRPRTMEDDATAERIATAYDGPRIRVAVGKFQELPGAEKLFEELGWPGLGPMVTEQAVTALVQTRRVAVLERSQLGKVITNIQLESEDETQKYFDQETTAKAGTFEGAQAVLIGIITQFEPNISGSDSGLSVPALGSLTYHEDRAIVALELRLVDQKTGRVIVAATGRADVMAQQAEVKAGIKGSDFGSKSFSNTPIGMALRDAVDVALLEMIPQLPAIDWVGHIVSAQNNRVFIDGGADLGLKGGDVFQLFRRGDAVTNAAGTVIGHQEDPIGWVKVLSVQAKMTVALVTELHKEMTPQAGDIVRLADDI